MNNQSYYLPYARITWQTPDTPYSPEFDDIYWSRGKGLSEKQHVFIEANQLANRWSTLQPGDKFTIVETGFGFGLNFLLCLKLWLTIPACKYARLEYIAFEKFLVRPDDLAKVGEVFPLRAELDKLLSVYPLPIPGIHPCWVADNVCLNLHIGDLNESLVHLQTEVDACFLDGFSPSQNRDMWLEDCLGHIAGKLKAGATTTSYTVAGWVRRGLGSQGLAISKIAGHGDKREMLFAKKPGQWQPTTKRETGKVVIVGAGIAGLQCAKALQRRGINATILDESETPLGAVAAFRQIAVYPQLSAVPQPYSLLYLRAFQFTQSHQPFEVSGRLELLENEADITRGMAIAKNAHLHCQRLSAEAASELAGHQLKVPALYHPHAGWFDPARLHQPDFDIRLNTQVKNMSWQDGNWTLVLANGDHISAGTVILATGHRVHHLLEPLDLKPVRGQGFTIHDPISGPNTIISGSKTWFPTANQMATLTATFDRGSSNSLPSSASELALKEFLQAYTDVDALSFENVVGIRSTTRDRMPIVDKVPDWSRLAAFCKLPPVQQYKGFTGYQPQLYCAVGFGSHGATLSPLSAEIIAREIADDNPVEVQGLLDANRFVLRDAGIKLPRPELGR